MPNRQDPDAPQETSQGASTEAHLARAATGQREGFARLYEKLAPAIYTWARLRIHESARSRIDTPVTTRPASPSSR